ncbi:MAG: hypothetical protein N4A47_05995 [Clostridia bacterium]|jgi:hypothetical protein|nr:hypothetical protein [Clostridia bacterium]
MNQLDENRMSEDNYQRLLPRSIYIDLLYKKKLDAKIGKFVSKSMIVGGGVLFGAAAVNALSHPGTFIGVMKSIALCIGAISSAGSGIIGDINCSNSYNNLEEELISEEKKLFDIADVDCEVEGYSFYARGFDRKPTHVFKLEEEKKGIEEREAMC